MRLHHVNLRRGGLSALFMLAISSGRRQRLFDQAQQSDKQALKQAQAGRRKFRADTLRAACRHELAQRAAAFQHDRKVMLDRHATDGVAMRAEWRQLAEDRKQAWSEHRRNFGQTKREKSADRMSSMNRRFNEAADGNEREKESGKAGGESRGSQGDAGSSGSVQPKEPQKGGWKARRNAAQRQSDGTYQPRNRPGRGRDRGR